MLDGEASLSSDAGGAVSLCLCVLTLRLWRFSDGLQRGLPHGSRPAAPRQHQLGSLAAGSGDGSGVRNQQGRPGHLPACVSPDNCVAVETRVVLWLAETARFNKCWSHWKTSGG